MKPVRSRPMWLLLTTALCWNLAAGQVTKHSSVNPELVTATNRFGYALLRQLAKQGRDENIFFSPLSMTLALSMAYNGAGGDTEREMRRALGFERFDLAELNESSAVLLEELTRDDAGLKLIIASSLWTRRDVKFNSGFLARNQKFYGADVSALDFDDPRSAAVINNWVARSTNGKIPGIIDELERDDALVLINAVYFKGAWVDPFDPSQTRDAVFHLPGGAQKQTPMMNQKVGIPAYAGDEVQGVSLTYATFGAQMELYMPAMDSSIAALLEKFDYDSHRRWRQAFQGRTVTLRLPRVKLEYSTDLKPSLQALGMRAAFTRAADFSRLASAADLRISDVIHKATLEVDEKGTEAAAATGVRFKPTSAPPPLDFIADRPFVVVISDRKSDAILFMGVVMDPQPRKR